MRLDGPRYAAPAKLNLFLHVLGRRADGYHLLQSALTLIDLADRLRIQVRDDGAVNRLNDLPGVPSEQDLVVQAARALQQASGTTLGADIEVEKRIPVGGGLGGGSSDAATTLLALNRLWELDLPEERLSALGLSLGADVPFFLFGRTAWAEGVGERLQALELAPRWYLVLVPPVSVPTAEIFAASELTRNTEALKMEDFSAQPWDARFHNDLEPVVVARYPAVREHLEWLRQRGAAHLTGSGACVFAPFERREQAQRVHDQLPGSMKGFVTKGLLHHPMRQR